MAKHADTLREIKDPAANYANDFGRAMVSSGHLFLELLRRGRVLEILNEHYTMNYEMTVQSVKARGIRATAVTLRDDGLTDGAHRALELAQDRIDEARENGRQVDIDEELFIALLIIFGDELPLVFEQDLGINRDHLLAHSEVDFVATEG